MDYHEEENGVNITDRMKNDFDKMLNSNISGQNWACDLIPDIGSGFPGTGHSISTRCVCWSRDGRQEQPTIRVSTSDEIKRGDMVYIPAYDGGTFFLIADQPQLEPNCRSVKATRCNSFVTIKATIPPAVDKNGYEITPDSEETERAIISNIPAVAKHIETVNGGSSVPGLTISDTLTLTMQLNEYTAAVQPETYFTMNHSRYNIYDSISDGLHHGTITFLCTRQAGGRE